MITLFLASVLGWYLVAFGLLVLLRSEHLFSVTREVLARRDLFFVLAVITFILGLLMVMSHNIWLMGWPVIVTIIGWLVLISGFIRLFFPEQAIQLGQAFFSKSLYLKSAAIVCLLIGLYLLLHVYYW